MIKQAVILAGGQGTRLRPITEKIPKPLVPINGKPFVQYIIEQLRENNIKEILFLTGYLGNAIQAYFKDGSKFGLHISYSSAPVEFESGARLRVALRLLDTTFLFLYCDNYWPVNVKQLLTYYKEKSTDALVTVYDNTDHYTKNNMHVNSNGLVDVYDKTRQKKGLNGVEIGYFIMKKKVLHNMPKTNFSFQDTIVPELIKNKQLSGFLTEKKYYGLSTLERIPVIEKYFKSRNIIFLDRDGVINKKPNTGEYVTNPKEFHILPTVIAALLLLKQNNFEIYIITNQAGIGRGKMTERDLQMIHKKFLALCKKNKIHINHIYFCPHDWKDNCSCRKPNPGMFFKAAAEFHFDVTKAVYIGDDIRDKKAGDVAGIRTIIMPANGDLLKTVNDIIKK